MSNNQEPQTETLAETENFMAWRADEPDDETTYYLQLGRATINFFKEEWEELLDSIPELLQAKPNEEGMYAVSFDNVDVWMDDEDWTEFQQIIRELGK
ncbi:MAG: hypothetical protein KJZ72_17950 [Anaerolineales bacterium]|nr:hypothetical protein [Anaerolineales bacterium]